MIRFYFIGLLLIFIIIPQNTRAMFLYPVLDIINATGGIKCLSDSTPTTDGYVLCAVRVYSYLNVDIFQNATIRDGISFTNTFRPFIETRNCAGFNGISDVGSGTCDLMSYETAANMTLCICATDNCNTDLQTCLDSIQTNQNVSVLPPVTANLTATIQCDDASDNSYTCAPHPDSTLFIDKLECSNFVKTHSVLCSITQTSSGSKAQLALVEENYQNYLGDRLHALKILLRHMSVDTLDETNTSIYVRYSISNVINEECDCTQNSSCNNNISTCSPNSIQNSTSDSTITDTSAPPDSTITDRTAINSTTPVTIATDFSNNSSISTDSTTMDTTAPPDSTAMDTVAPPDSTTMDTVAPPDFTTMDTAALPDSTTSDTTATNSTTPVTIATDSSSTSSTSTNSATIGTAAPPDSTTTDITATNSTTPITRPTDSSSISSTSTDSAQNTNATTSFPTTADITVNTTTTAISMTNTSMANVTDSTVADVAPNATGLSHGAIAGIVVGATLTAVIILSLIVLKFVNSGSFQWPFNRSSDYVI